MVIFCGSDEPQRAFPAFMIASGALATDMSVMMFFTMDGLNIIRKGGAEKIEMPDAPMTLPEFIETVRDAGAKLVACSAAFAVAGIREEDLIEGVKCGGVATFVIAAQDASTVLTF